MKYVKPCNDRNAIKTVAFAFEFAEEVDENLIQDLIILHQNNETLKKDLPRKQVHQSLTLQLENPQQTSSKNEGITFDRLTPEGSQEWAVSLRNKTIVVSCGKYTRWDDIWKKAKIYFNIVLPIFSEKTCTLLALEYIDEFIVEDGKDSKWKKELFNSDSTYLPSNIHELESFWHSHHGFFVEDTKQINIVTLNSINVDYFSELDVSKVTMRTQHKSQLKSPISLGGDFLDKTADSIIIRNHTFNKTIMKSLLSSEMCSEINMEI